tara:strand:- start:2073 stop:2573 length:501 start_codon:yes stop_codon:yes gene_type:complete
LGYFKSAKILVLALVLGHVFLESVVVSAQSIVENIKPIGQVCLLGQNCVGIKITDTNTDDTAQSLEGNTSEDSQEDVNINEALGIEGDDFDAAATYQTSCFACHASGAAGAPLLGDLEAWNSRMEKGMDVVMANVINGINAMPARGLCMDCADNELRAIVDYMIAQ